jgi:tetratricopeptide (TPR) repeat protein
MQPSESAPTRFRRWAALIPASLVVFLAALLVRGVYLFQSADNPTFFCPVVDAYAYDRLATILASGQMPGSSIFWQPVFYPFFLAGIYSTFGPHMLVAKIFQMFLGSVTCVLVYWIGRLAFSPRIGLIAGLVVALYGPIVFIEAELLNEGWALFWLALLLVLLLVAARSDSPFLCLAIGAVGVMAALARPPLLFVFLAASLGLLRQWRTRMEWRDAVVRGWLVLVGFGFVGIHVAYINHRATGDFGILPYSTGINLYLGNNPQWEKTVTARPGGDWDAITALPAKAGVKAPWDQSAWFVRQVKQYARAHPGLFLKGLAAKTVRFFNSRELPRNVDLYVFRKWSSLLAALVWTLGPFGFPFGALWPLAALGLATQWRRIPFPIWSLLLVYPATIILCFVASRYRILVVPALAVLAAAGVNTLLEFVRARDRRRLLLSAALVLGLAVLSAFPARFAEENPALAYEAELYRFIGREHCEAGQHLEALPFFRKAIALRPDYADAISEMAYAYLNLDRTDEALPYARRAAELRPDDPLYHFNLAAIHIRKRDLPEAEQLLARSVEIDPDYLPARINLGFCLFDQGKLDAAAVQFRHALRIDPRNPNALNGLSLIREARNKPGK